MERFSSSQGHYELHYELAESMFRRRRGSLTCKTDGKLGNTTRTVTAASTASRSSRVLVKKKKEKQTAWWVGIRLITTLSDSVSWNPSLKISVGKSKNPPERNWTNEKLQAPRRTRVLKINEETAASATAALTLTYTEYITPSCLVHDTSPPEQSHMCGLEVSDTWMSSQYYQSISSWLQQTGCHLTCVSP